MITFLCYHARNGVTMKYFLIIMTIILMACGSKNYYPAFRAKDAENDACIFDDYFQLPNNNFIELLEMKDARVIVQQQQTYVTNKDQTTGYIPSIPITPLIVKADNTLFYYRNFNFTKDVNGLKKDLDNRYIVGVKRIEYTLSFDDDCLLTIKIVIKNGVDLIDAVIFERGLHE